jgi:hypothetical protein
MPNWRRYASRHARYSAGIHYKGVRYSNGCLIQMISVLGVIGIIITALIIII